MERLIELTKRHNRIMKDKNIIVQIYTNASGFLWAMSKVDSGTNLGWSKFKGDCKHTGTFTSYENALEDAINLIDKCDLKKFKEENPNNKFHWGNYSRHLNANYR